MWGLDWKHAKERRLPGNGPNLFLLAFEGLKDVAGAIGKLGTFLEKRMTEEAMKKLANRSFEKRTPFSPKTYIHLKTYIPRYERLVPDACVREGRAERERRWRHVLARARRFQFLGSLHPYGPLPA
ncbi:unnamed protein product [Darwinula stevensoni]|uniref:Sulfotransferase n=1 Tax=Darwinula stevensoni TaxID=69355 RepID=A0A7R9A4K0_9CRUS|nr:unnamed protein product [Darwinula stevensoni]CAG0883551.1 unnamed protein product [Darwinula stevensoni]